MGASHGIRELNKKDVYVNEEKRCAWVTNPKVASSSIRHNLITQGSNLPTLHNSFHLVPLPEIIRGNIETALVKLQDYFFFCFVRHPESRLISAYKNKIDRYMPPKNVFRMKQQILEYLDKDPEDINQKITFDQFICSIVDQDPRRLNRHWRPQSLVLDLKNIDYAYIGKLETFRTSWEELCALLEIPFSDIASLFEEKALKQSKYADQVVVRPNIRSLIEEYFSDDYRNFNYQ